MGEGGHDAPRFTEFGYRLLGSRIRVQALAEVATIGLIEAVGQLIDDPPGKISGQFSKVASDQAGPGMACPLAQRS